MDCTNSVMSSSTSARNRFPPGAVTACGARTRSVQFVGIVFRLPDLPRARAGRLWVRNEDWSRTTRTAPPDERSQTKRPTGHARKSTGQTEGQFGRDMMGRKGQFTGRRFVTHQEVSGPTLRLGGFSITARLRIDGPVRTARRRRADTAEIHFSNTQETRHRESLPAWRDSDRTTPAQRIVPCGV